MAVEYVLLLIITVMFVVKAFYGEDGLPASFQKASPKLAAKLERQIETGAAFNHHSREQNLTDPVNWNTPDQQVNQP